MKKAIFLDRDGVINKLIYNPNTKEYESPHHRKDFELHHGAIESLNLLKKDFLLFLISNQPSYAKGKTSLENIKSIHHKLHKLLMKNNIAFIEYFYCYHHPDGIVNEYSFECECRKPNPFFLLHAKNKYTIDMKNSWFIGDQDTDIFCGQKANLKTILIKNEKSEKKRGKSNPEFYADNLIEAVKIITGGFNELQD